MFAGSQGRKLLCVGLFYKGWHRVPNGLYLYLLAVKGRNLPCVEFYQAIFEKLARIVVGHLHDLEAE